MPSINNTQKLYIFDTDILSNIFTFYYYDRFPTFWEKFNKLLDDGVITSVREVKKELEDAKHINNLADWMKKYDHIFSLPTNDELSFVTKIYSIQHFQQNLEQRKKLNGGAFADPFLIAKAKITNATVVTREKEKVNSAKIPNICKHFKINCLNLEGFLTSENWTF